MKPRRLDVAQQLMLRYVLVVSHCRDDVPVPERGVTGDDRQRAAALEIHLARRDGVNGGAIGRRDVDPEVKRPRRPSDTRIVERAAHWMRPIERSQRPAVQISKRTPTRTVAGRGSVAHQDWRALEPASPLSIGTADGWVTCVRGR